MIVRFATFNIRTGKALDGRNSWPLRRRATSAAISALHADLVGLQEVHEFQRHYLDQRLEPGRWFGQARGGGTDGEQCPIVVTSPSMTVLDHWTRWYGPEPDTPGTRLPGALFPRIATMVQARDQTSGTVFSVVNTHLDERIGANRAASMRQLVEWLHASTPTVIMGDFNAEPDDVPVLGPLAEAGFEIVPVTGGSSHGFSGRADGRLIDHVLVSKHWTVEDAAVVRDRPFGQLPSDHWPVCVTARLASRAG